MALLPGPMWLDQGEELGLGDGHVPAGAGADSKSVALELFPGDAAGDVLDLGRGQGGGAVSYTHLTLPTTPYV